MQTLFTQSLSAAGQEVKGSLQRTPALRVSPSSPYEEIGTERGSLGPRSPPVKGRAETQHQFSFSRWVLSILSSSFWSPILVPQLPAHMVKTWTGSENRAFVFHVHVPVVKLLFL